MNNCVNCSKFYKLPANRVMNPNLGFCKLFNQTVDVKETCNAYEKDESFKKENELHHRNQALAKKLKIKFESQFKLFENENISIFETN